MEQKIIQRKDIILKNGSEIRHKMICFSISVMAVLTVILFWYLISWLKPELMPTPVEVVKRLVDMIVKPENGVSLLYHVFTSFYRVIAAYTAATAAGVLLGVAFGWNKIFYDYVGPIFNFLRPIPPIAWIPLVVVWFGIGEISKMAIIFIGAFVPIVVNTHFGLMQMDPIYEKAGKMIGANRREMLFEIVIPASFPQILAGMKTALSQSWACVIAAEMIVAKRGLGYLIVRSMESGNMGNVLISIIFISGISFLLSYLFTKLEEIICPW